MTIPVWFQDWYNNGSGGIAAAAQTYIDRVEADGGAVESIGCVPSAVWDWIAPSFIGLLDLFPNAAAAYSLRKLRAAYSGSAVRVRKEVSLVSSETDIGFLADGTLDTVSLLAFASDADRGDVFVVTWYDQSLSNDATQSAGASQPKIVSGGSLVEENGKAAVDFSISAEMVTSASGIYAQPNTYFIIAKNNNANSDFIDAVNTSGDRNLNDINGGFHRIFAGLSFQSTFSDSINQFLRYSLFDGASSEIAIDGASVETGNVGLLGLDKSFSIGDNASAFEMQELIIYNSDQSANRAAIETNINTFYSIYS
jgi:hypothetical protein